MIRANLRVLVLFAIAPFAVLPAFAAAPSTGVVGGPNGPAPPDKGTTSIQEYQGLGVDRQLTSFAGVVLDVTDHPLDKVLVQLFVDGRMTGNSLTDPSGYYEIKIPFDSRGDTTVLLWYVPLERSLLPKEIVLRESKVSQANGLISRCVPRATVTPGHQFRVYLFDPSNRNRDIAELNCLQ